MNSRLSSAGRQRLRVIIIGITLLLILWVFFSPWGIGRHLQIQKRLAAIEQEIAVLEKDNQVFAETNDRLTNDIDYLEEVARRKFGMVRENEIIYDFSRGGR